MFGKTLFTRPARDLATTSTSQFRPGPSGRPLLKRSLTFLHKVQDLKHFFHRSRSQEETEDARLQENASAKPSFQGLSHSSENFLDMAKDDPRPQVPHPGSPTLTPSPTDLSTFLPVQAEVEGSATSTPAPTFSATTSPQSISTTPISIVLSSPHSFEPHPDLLALNQRIAVLEVIAKQIEQEHADYVKEAREMDATLTSIEKEVDSAIEVIKSVNRKTALEAEESMKLETMWRDELRAISKAEGDLFWAKHNYEKGQKNYANLQARFENLQQERERQRIEMHDGFRPS
ncbi:hypothetical protein M407DRAFT_27090 [Tulasnella calospora MUT 4182]|uniref:Uncharacterized protein n=1 Tax=Tulasnella calospora MUT 4182 TaxID=1051891 RepID=A0A0C3Q3R1_9AGAM|nr:hypothetical protein M407DRAFT_27090 [Tulasnella calospora MUT 4182]